MIKKRAKLEIILLKLFRKYNAEEEVFNNLILELREKMYTARVTGIFDMSMDVTLISDEELYLITQGLYNVTGKIHEEINPEKWFSPYEMEVGNTKKTNSIEEDLIIFHELSRKPSPNRDIPQEEKIEGAEDYDNEWIGYISYGEIKRAWECGLLTYNQNTQRAGRMIELFGHTYVVPTIFKANVGAIKDKIVRSEFHTNMLTFNITSTSTERIVYNSKNRDLKVINSEIAVIDGAHRLLAIVRAVNEKPELARQYTAVMIKNLPVSLAQQFIKQESLGMRQDARTLALVDTEDVTNKLCRNINKEIVDNSLKGKIGMNISEYDNCLIPLPKMIEALNDAFEDVLDLEDENEIQKLQAYIIEFFNIVIERNEKYYKGDIDDLKEKYISCSSNFTVGLIHVAGKLYGKIYWYKELNEILNNLDWEKANPVWKENKILSSKLSALNKKKIYRFFDEML